MITRRISALEETAALIDGAVQSHALAVLSTQTPEGWITFKSRFLERDPRQKFFVLDYQETHGCMPPGLSPGQYLGVSFRHKSRKLLCSTVVEAKGRFVTSTGESVAAVRYRWPGSLTEMQRRAYYRTPVPSSTTLLAAVWPGGAIARDSAQSLPLKATTCEALDLSCGGTLLRVNGVAPPSFALDETVGVELRLPDGRPPLMVNAHYRGTRHDERGHACLAIQFVGLELEPENRSILQRLARCIQKFSRQSLPLSHSQSGSFQNEEGGDEA